jgi:paired amphipathic helix protein Sin3a
MGPLGAGQMPPASGHSSSPPTTQPIALPPLGQVMMHNPAPLPGIDQQRQAMLDRETREREARDREARERDARERDARDREQRDREAQAQRLDRPPHVSAALPIHQPVAQNIATAIHAPGGLLSSVPTPSPAPMYTPAPYAQDRSLAALSQPPMQMMQQNAHGNFHAAMVPPSQQPILNDALTYLENVKNQLPQKYNEFLDIMKDFKSQA